MKNEKVKVTCSRCILDSATVEGITFNKLGVCSYCQSFDLNSSKLWFPDDVGQKKIKLMVEELQAYRKKTRQKYDCLVGVSGGLDSSYLLLKLVEWGLNPLVLHVDAGWNSELAVKNIENLINELNLDLYTEVIDWTEMKALQLAFLKSGVPNQDIPQDHSFAAATYKYAKKFNLKYIIRGTNFSTECILPKSYGYDAMDSVHINAIFKKYNGRSIDSSKYPLISYIRQRIQRRINGYTFFSPLNYIYYSIDESIVELHDKVGWKYYGGKHRESRFTRFFQDYYLPTRFGIDKRNAHYSSMINSGLISREEVLEKMEQPLYTELELKVDKEFIAKKLDISVDELDGYISQPLTSHKDFSQDRFFRFLESLYRKLS